MAFIRYTIVSCVTFFVACNNEPTAREAILNVEIRTNPITIVMSPCGKDTAKSWTQDFLPLIKMNDSIKWVQTNSTDFPLIHSDLQFTSLKVYQKGEVIWIDSAFEPKNLDQSIQAIKQKLFF